MKRATIYLDEELHKALKMRAVEVSSSISDLVNDAVRASLEEDLEDLRSFEERKAEPTIKFEQFLKRLAKRGKLSD